MTNPVTAASIQLVALILTGEDWRCHSIYFGYVVSHQAASVFLTHDEAAALFAEGLASADARRGFRDELKKALGAVS